MTAWIFTTWTTTETQVETITDDKTALNVCDQLDRYHTGYSLQKDGEEIHNSLNIDDIGNYYGRA